MKSAPIASVRVLDSVLAGHIDTNRKTTIPWAIKACHDTGRFAAFELKWKPGAPNEPHVYWDSDVAKVLEGMALDLQSHPDAAREAELQSIVDLIVSAQQPDGYLNTHFTVVEPQNRWKRLYDLHELYCAGHLIEAAVEHHAATGRREFLDAMCRYADYIGAIFGRGRGQKRGYPGHEEIELALVKLAAATGKKKYLRLSKYFVDERGQKPNYFTEIEGAPANLPHYLQSDVPVREQKEAQGHAVRACYLYAGMADVAAATNDTALLDVCRRLFDDIASRKMYITGGIGSKRENESFENAYKLPSLEAYAESCASIALVFFAQRMHNITGETKYLDVAERALYNGIPAGISVSGDRFFYRNPLRSSIDSPYERERQSWFWCSCCPTNFCRFYPQVGSLLWSEGEGEIRLNIPAASTFRATNGATLNVKSGYPYDGNISVTLETVGENSSFTLSLRIPSWCERVTARVNGKAISAKKLLLAKKNGLLRISRPWKAGDVVEMDLDMPCVLLRANAAVDDCAGKLALQRGPIVYALESVDNGPLLQRYSVPADATWKPRAASAKSCLPKGTVLLETHDALVDPMPAANAPLYAPANGKNAAAKRTKLTAIPYALWQNRGPSEMSVWFREHSR